MDYKYSFTDDATMCTWPPEATVL